jgi:hypothetical protein
MVFEGMMRVYIGLGNVITVKQGLDLTGALHARLLNQRLLLCAWKHADVANLAS